MALNSKPRIALIAPQVIGFKHQVRKATPPFGIACLAAVLEENGYTDILLIDAVVEDYDNVVDLDDGTNFVKFGLSDENMVKRLEAFRPDLVAISSLFSSQTECAFALSRAIKKAFPNVPIVFGGNHISGIRTQVLEEEETVDFVISGESDYTFLDFVEKYFAKQDFSDVPGLVWRENNGIKENPKAPYIKDINELPFPAFHLYPMERYFEIGMSHNPFTVSPRVGCVFTSRGCPQRCYFCTVPDYLGFGFRALSAERTIELIKWHVDKFEIRELQVLDDNFTVDYKRVIKICEGIKHLKLRISFPNATRADVPKNRKYRHEMYKAMKEAGVAQVGLSPEHGDQDFLNNVIKKQMSLEEVVESTKMLQDLGIMVHANFMMGFPFETAEHRQKTIDFARNLKADSYSVSLVAPLPNTGIWDVVEKNNLFVEGFNVNRMVFSAINIKPHDISPEDLYKTVDKLNRELNEEAQRRSPAAREKYKLFKGKKSEGDRKYHFVEAESL